MRALAQAREPAADRLVQDPRRDQRGPAGLAGGAGGRSRDGERREHGPGSRLGGARGGRDGDHRRPRPRAADEARRDRTARRPGAEGAARALVADDGGAPARRGRRPLRPPGRGRAGHGRQRNDRARGARGPARRGRGRDPLRRRRPHRRDRERGQGAAAGDDGVHGRAGDRSAVRRLVRRGLAAAGRVHTLVRGRRRRAARADEDVGHRLRARRRRADGVAGRDGGGRAPARRARARDRGRGGRARSRGRAGRTEPARARSCASCRAATSTPRGLRQSSAERLRRDGLRADSRWGDRRAAPAARPRRDGRARRRDRRPAGDPVRAHRLGNARAGRRVARTRGRFRCAAPARGDVRDRRRPAPGGGRRTGRRGDPARADRVALRRPRRGARRRQAHLPCPPPGRADAVHRHRRSLPRARPQSSVRRGRLHRRGRRAGAHRGRAGSAPRRLVLLPAARMRALHREHRPRHDEDHGRLPSRGSPKQRSYDAGGA